MSFKPQTLDEALDKIEKVRQIRRGKFYLRGDTITMSHGIFHVHDFEVDLFRLR